MARLLWSASEVDGAATLGASWDQGLQGKRTGAVEQLENHPIGMTEGPPAPAPGADTTGTAAYSYVYALGRVESRFPSLAVEKEFAQAVGRAETAKLTDRQALQNALAARSNRYL